jgi:hypothetical protein
VGLIQKTTMLVCSDEHSRPVSPERPGRDTVEDIIGAKASPPELLLRAGSAHVGNVGFHGVELAPAISNRKSPRGSVLPRPEL